jgi:hypothetical protein
VKIDTDKTKPTRNTATGDPLTKVGNLAHYQKEEVAPAMGGTFPGRIHNCEEDCARSGARYADDQRQESPVLQLFKSSLRLFVAPPRPTWSTRYKRSLSSYKMFF